VTREPTHLAAVPFELLHPATYLKRQVDLVKCQISDGEVAVVAWGPDEGALYVHLSSGGIMRAPSEWIVEAAYRSLNASEVDAWTRLERDSELDVDPWECFRNGIVVVDRLADECRVRRVDGQPYLDVRHPAVIAAEIFGEDYSVASVELMLGDDPWLATIVVDGW
jgi:hypothetical protein